MPYADCIHFVTNPETPYPYYRWSPMLGLFGAENGDMLKGRMVCSNSELNS